MKASFWHKCWEKNSLGFHQEQMHPFLSQYLLPLINDQDKHVFVPLCGKSLDMFWLAQHMNVSGSELSEIACRDFFSNADLDVKTSVHQNNQSKALFNLFSFNNITLWQGDFFKLIAQDLLLDKKSVDWIYDRAALIALPSEMRESYIKHLISFIGTGTRLFLISIEFPPDEISGPPFSINHQSISELFLSVDKGCHVECIASRELTDKRFGQRSLNVSLLKECLYIITKS